MAPVLRFFVAAIVLGIGAAPAGAHEYKLGDLEIIHPWSRATTEGTTNAAVFFKIDNRGTTPDRLVVVASSVTTSAEIQTPVVENGVMSIRRQDAIEIPGGEQIALTHDGTHVVLIGLTEKLIAESMFGLTLTFERAGSVTVQVYVEEAETTSSADE